jgi:hypothetical protein
VRPLRRHRGGDGGDHFEVDMKTPLNVPVTKMPKIKPLTTTALKMMLASGAISGRP